MVNIQQDFVAVGGNRHPCVAAWDSQNHLLAYGAYNNIALWDPLDNTHKGVHGILKGHTEDVNVVSFLQYEASPHSLLLSGSADKTIRIWIKDTSSPNGYTCAKVLTEHQGAINCIAALQGSAVFVSGAADYSLKVWRLKEGNDSDPIDIELLQTVSLTPKFFPLALSLTRLGQSDTLVLAVAGTKTFIQIYVSQESHFKLSATLTGHEGWVRSLSFASENNVPGGDLILASASQDKYIRLWRIHQGEQLPSASNAASNPALGMLGKALSNKAHRFTADSTPYSVTFEALLLGHDDWIYSTAWNQHGDKFQLLSASADNSLAIWEADPNSGIWVCIARLGEISAQKGSTTATGSTGGFWTGLWNHEGDAVACLGRTGSWRMWRHNPAEDRWIQDLGISGHFKDVKSIAWASTGDGEDDSYLLTTSSDQTTRLYAEWKRDDQRSWHEFSRPQIHGYDLNCIDSIGSSRFISGADEKLLRVFDEPKAVADVLARLCGLKTSDEDLPDAANIPVLGLSNKAIEAVDDDVSAEAVVDTDADSREAVDPSSVVHKSTLNINQPPFEDHLARHMLWPEREKLYGHGYEISCVATSYDKTLVATACRASSIDHAVIRLYDTKDWREIKPSLTAHSLTVTNVAFSGDDRYLLSVGRDRQWALFERAAEGSTEYTPLAVNPKGHSRMILDCSWASLQDAYVFATAGRDKAVKIWKLEGEDASCVTPISADAAVTAVAFDQRPGSGPLMLAYGTEAGDVVVCIISREDFSVQSSVALDKRITPSKVVNKLSWRPGADQSGRRQLAVASDDNSVRIYTVTVP